MSEYKSLWEFLEKAAGPELGAKVFKAFISEYPKGKIQKRYVENSKYKGYVDLYPKSFLDSYFKRVIDEDEDDDLPF